MSPRPEARPQPCAQLGDEWRSSTGLRTQRQMASSVLHLASVHLMHAMPAHVSHSPRHMQGPAAPARHCSKRPVHMLWLRGAGTLRRGWQQQGAQGSQAAEARAQRCRQSTGWGRLARATWAACRGVRMSTHTAFWASASTCLSDLHNRWHIRISLSLAAHLSVGHTKTARCSATIIPGNASTA